MFAKIIRILGVITLLLTTAMHLLGGIGTTCVAFAAEKYDSMSGIVPYKTLYQVFVFLTLAISVYGIFATAAYLRGKAKAYTRVVIFLMVALLLSGIHMYTSLALRGGAAPINVRVYLNVLTLLVWLLFLPPGVRPSLVDGGRDEGSAGAAGAALIVVGVLTLTVQYWAAPSHIMNGGINYADAFHLPMTIAGWVTATLGAALLRRDLFRKVEVNPVLSVGQKAA